MALRMIDVRSRIVPAIRRRKPPGGLATATRRLTPPVRPGFGSRDRVFQHLGRLVHDPDRPADDRAIAVRARDSVNGIGGSGRLWWRPVNALVVLPTFNEAENIVEVLDRIRAARANVAGSTGKMGNPK